MTDDASSQLAAPDMTFPPNPFHHGPCRFNKANGYANDCPNPAVFDGGACAPHVTAIAAANARSGYDAMGKTKLAPKAHGVKRDRAKAKMASASRRRNRR